jgi:hypothetical protein
MADQGCPSQLALERYELGEIEGTASAPTAEHIRTCPTCAQSLKTIRAGRDSYRASAAAARVRAALVEAPRPVRRPPRLAVGMALAASLLIGLAIWRVAPGPARDVFQPKGPGAIAATIQRGTQTFAWDGTPIRPGDRVQLIWRGSPGFLAVLGRWDEERWEAVHPQGAPLAEPVVEGAVLGNSIVVETGRTRLHLVGLLGKEPFDTGRAAAEADSGVKPSPNLEVVSLELPVEAEAR